MAFDGMLRAGQSLPYSNDALNPNTSASRARVEKDAASAINGPGKSEKTSKTSDESDGAGNFYLPFEEQNGEPDPKTLTGEAPIIKEIDSSEHANPARDLETWQALTTLARTHGVQNFKLDATHAYRFHFNSRSGVFDLLDETTGRVQIQLTPTELFTLSERLHRSAGLLTDRTG